MFQNMDVASVGQYVLYAVIMIGGGYLVSTGKISAEALGLMVGGLGFGHGGGAIIATKSTTKALNTAHTETIRALAVPPLVVPAAVPPA